MGFKAFQFPVEQSINIPMGNTKLGGIPNTSFPPVISCPTDIPCISGCYAVKYYKRYPQVREAYLKNFEIYKTDSNKYWKQLQYFLSVKSPSLFRYAVSGDIPEIPYLLGMIKTAKQFRNTTFTVYTKQYEFLRLGMLSIPKNLIVMASAWAGYPIPQFILDNYRIAWVNVPRETRYKSRRYLYCKKSCFACRVCYNQTETSDVLLDPH